MKIKALFLKKVYGIANKINEDIYIYQDDDKIVFQSIQSGLAVLLELIYKTECKKSDNPIVFELRKIKNIISILNDDDNIELIKKDEYVLFKTKSFSRKVRLIVPDKPRFTFPDERKDKPLIFTHEIDIFNSSLKNAINASSDISNHISFKLYKDKLDLIREDKTDEFKYELKDEKIKIVKFTDIIENMYSDEYINNFCTSVDGKLKIKLIKDGPIKFENKPIKDLTIKYTIAPMVKVDDEL